MKNCKMVKKGCDILGRYNLLDEPWIMVMTEDGENKKVSLKAVFQHAHTYRSLAGDMATQDFAVMRVLLAVLHTVFSRVNAAGETYKYLTLDARYVPQNEIEEDDADDYGEELFETWEILWRTGRFPEIVATYLEAWRDRFYLFDETYPFYQVTKESIAPDKINKAKGGIICGKNINRLISESANPKKIALFSPKDGFGENKEVLSEDEVVRWLITYQSYSGLTDKLVFKKGDYKVTEGSPGWLFDIGGIYINGNNLFQTLWLNCMLWHTEESYRIERQCPCWEYTGEYVISKYLNKKSITNLAALYTDWSRAVYISPSIDITKGFSLQSVILPKIEYENRFLEPLTMWISSKDEKDVFKPKEHNINESFWRSFGLLIPINKEERYREPGIVRWIKRLREYVKYSCIQFSAVGMKKGGKKSLCMPIDEIYDELQLSYEVIADAYWIPRINDAVEDTKDVIGRIYWKFIKCIQEIRFPGDSKEIKKKRKRKTEWLVQELYFSVDVPFRRWLAGLQVTGNKEMAIREWYRILRNIIEDKVRQIVRQAGNRESRGIVIKDEGIKNIFIIYNEFTKELNKKLPRKRGG